MVSRQRGGARSASGVDGELDGKLSALQTLATSPLFTPESRSEIYEQAKQVAEYLGSSIVIFDATSRSRWAALSAAIGRVS